MEIPGNLATLGSSTADPSASERSAAHGSLGPSLCQRRFKQIPLVDIWYRKCTSGTNNVIYAMFKVCYGILYGIPILFDIIFG